MEKDRRIGVVQACGSAIIAGATATAILFLEGPPWWAFAIPGVFIGAVLLMILEEQRSVQSKPMLNLASGLFLGLFGSGFVYLFLEDHWIFGVGALLFGFPAAYAFLMCGWELAGRREEPGKRVLLGLFILWIFILAAAYGVRHAGGPSRPLEVERR